MDMEALPDSRTRLTSSNAADTLAALLALGLSSRDAEHVILAQVQTGF